MYFNVFLSNKVSALLCTTLTHVLSATIGLEYLDPIIHQEHIQSPNGRYNYGYESNRAQTHQVHDSDGTTRGFYSYLDDQGKTQRVEYVADHNGFNVVGNSGSPIVPTYTPDVEAARNAHMQAYLEAHRQGLEQLKGTLATERKQIATIHNHLPASIPVGYVSKPVQTHVTTHSTWSDDDSINLFSGQPLGSTHQDFNLQFTTSNAFQTTTIRPRVDYITANVENKAFNLPTPAVQHYEKIWPLPANRYKDLEIRVNGNDWYDPRPRYNERNWFTTPQFETIQNTAPFAEMSQTVRPRQSSTFHNPPANQFSNSGPQMNQNEVPKAQYVLQPVTMDPTVPVPQSSTFHNPPANQFSNSGPETNQNEVPRAKYVFQSVSFDPTAHQTVVRKEEPLYNFGPQQTISQSLDFNDATELSPNSQPTNINQDFNTDHFEQPSTPGLTAHQIELLNYKQNQLTNSNVPNTYFENQNINYLKVNSIPINKSKAKSPITKIVVRKSHIGVQKNIVPLAARKAFDAFKAKYNLS